MKILISRGDPETQSQLSRQTHWPFLLKVVLLVSLAFFISACGSSVDLNPLAEPIFTYCIRLTQEGDPVFLANLARQEEVSYCLQISLIPDEEPPDVLSAEVAPTPDLEASLDPFNVDPLFTDFYNQLGGVKILGPALTPLIEVGEVKRQYVQAGLLEYDPKLRLSDQYRLSPLALDFGIEEPPAPPPEGEGSRYVGGQVITPEFVPLYDRLGGSRYVGKPLTAARHNPEKGRIEQYFENLGLYRLDQDDPQNVRLLAYGLFACDQLCRFQAPPANILSLEARLPEPFSSRVARLGISFIGRNLTPVYVAEDGRLDVIFENLVLSVDPADPEDFHPRPIVHLLGMSPDSPVACKQDPLTICFLADGENGYNVPLVFNEFLAERGWLSISGFPTTEIFHQSDGVFRQCFTNLCLDFDLNANLENRLRLTPLGNEYKQLFYTPAQVHSYLDTQSLEAVRIGVWESETYIATDQYQEIHVAIFEEEIPLANREPVLVVTMPDNSQKVLVFPPTSEDGMTYLSLPPIQAPSGTLIAYQVCLKGVSGEELCVADNYLIWNYP
jgi:hypothetical protein